MSSVTVQAVDMTQPIRDVPRLFLAHRAPGAGYAEPKEGHGFRYRARAHSELPHVMKFSGGRSSGMLLFTLLENRFLRLIALRAQGRGEGVPDAVRMA